MLVGAVVLLLVAELLHTGVALVHFVDAPRYSVRFVVPSLYRWLLLRRACTEVPVDFFVFSVRSLLFPVRFLGDSP